MPMRTGIRSNATLQGSSETWSIDDAKMQPARSYPTDSQIATVAYQLWLEKGCPVGSDQEDWFRAEAMLKNALVAKREDPSNPRRDPRTEPEVAGDLIWKGHWEVWEMEWDSPRWVSD